MAAEAALLEKDALIRHGGCTIAPSFRVVPPGGVMCESAPPRRSARTILAARRIPAMLVALGLIASGTLVPLGAVEPAAQGRQKEPQPTPRWFHSAAVVDDKIYVIGGVGADNQPTTSVEVYDPTTGRWAECASMPTARAGFGASAVGGKIYAVGGTTTGLDGIAVVEAYDPATDTWTRKADMPTPRQALSVITVGGRVYAIGGGGLDRPDDGRESVDPTVTGTDFSTVEVYDPQTDTWATGADMPTPRPALTASAVGGKIYTFGGQVRRGDVDETLSRVEVYDTATNGWASAADLPTPRFFPASGVIDGRIYVVGGAASHGSASSQEERMRLRTPLSVVEVYDPASGRWTTTPDLANPRGWLSASVVAGRLYVIGGRSSAPEGGILEVDGALPGIEAYTPPH
jgi:N-acetylneuraminic acid mutarotase